MPISASATVAPDCRFSPRPLQAGFTLLEVLVVVTLMVVVSTLMVTAALRGGAQDPAAKAAAQFSDVVTLMTENSLFRGELLALRLQYSGWEPLRFDVTTGEFMPLTKPLQATALVDGVGLEWLLEEGRDRDRPDIAEAGAGLISDDITAGEKPQPPQVFFFPSGEVSPLTVWLTDQNSGERHELKIDALGVVKMQAESAP
jgi:general secretion pathway protein H